nr:MAG TPA: DNA ligase [Caudoviricetes sp.]
MIRCKYTKNIYAVKISRNFICYISHITPSWFSQCLDNHRYLPWSEDTLVGRVADCFKSLCQLWVKMYP